MSGEQTELTPEQVYEKGKGLTGGLVGVSYGGGTRYVLRLWEVGVHLGRQGFVVSIDRPGAERWWLWTRSLVDVERIEG
jgi:hypothetical protein